MSAAAIPIYKLLLAKGVSEDEARQAAEAVVAETESHFAENLQAAKTHADNAVAKSEEKADAKYVSQTRFHEMDKSVATRADLSMLEKSMSARMLSLEDRVDRKIESGFADLRRDNADLRRESKFTNRIGLGILVALFVFVAKFVISA